MYDVFDAYDSRENLIVEAQVGIGKSFGYLIPGILISKILKAFNCNDFLNSIN